MPSLNLLAIKNSSTTTKQVRGFTLIEMITVIVLLGVVSVGIGSFIRIGSQAYVDVTARDELIGGARFAVERLNRELRAALPNSARVTSSGSTQCLEFIPSLASTIYQDIPVLPEDEVNSFNVIAFGNDDGRVGAGIGAVVYPVNHDDLYTGTDRNFTISGLTPLGGNIVQVNFDGPVRYAEDSPTSRIFFVDEPVSYCIVDTELRRFDGGYSKTNTVPTDPATDGVLMAENLLSGSAPFTVDEASHLRNAIIRAQFTFERDGERITFNNEVQVVNVP